MGESAVTTLSAIVFISILIMLILFSAIYFSISELAEKVKKAIEDKEDDKDEGETT